MSLGCNRLDESRRKTSDEMSCTRLGEARLYKVTSDRVVKDYIRQSCNELDELG